MWGGGGLRPVSFDLLLGIVARICYLYAGAVLPARQIVNNTMDTSHNSPLESLHQIQKEEYERYLQNKQEYTQMINSAELPEDKRKELLAGVDAVSWNNSVKDYVKLRFPGVLSPTERYLWKSLFKYTHDYDISFKDFKIIVETFFIPLPENYSLEDVYRSMPNHRWVKLQDDNGKLLCGPFEEMDGSLDFSLTRYLKQLDELFSELNDYFDDYHLDVRFGQLCSMLRDNLVLTNCTFSQFFIRLFIQEQGEVPEKVRTYCNPDGVTLYHSDVLMSYVGIALFSGVMNKADSPYDVKFLLDGVYSTVRIMQGYCAFVAFCSSLLIATLSDLKYQDSLLDMMCFFLYNFHNSYIFRIEIPNAPLNEQKSIEERGSEDHTTRMKIYLYDVNRVPYVVRVDMPHKGDGDESKLHFNVETLDGDSPLNHKAIDCVVSNPADLLDVMIDNMRRMTPNILSIKDSYKEDDKRMLELMKAFNAYYDLCMAFFMKNENQAALEVFNSLMGTDCKTVDEGIQEGYISFSTM